MSIWATQEAVAEELGLGVAEREEEEDTQRRQPKYRQGS